MITSLFEAPFSSTFIAEFMRVTKVFFGDNASQDWLNSLKWRLEQMPDVIVFTKEIGLSHSWI